MKNILSNLKRSEIHYVTIYTLKQAEPCDGHMSNLTSIKCPSFTITDATSVDIQTMSFVKLRSNSCNFIFKIFNHFYVGTFPYKRASPMFHIYPPVECTFMFKYFRLRTEVHSSNVKLNRLPYDFKSDISLITSCYIQ